MLQPGQPHSQRLVALHQLREPLGPRGDLLILRADPPGLLGELLSLASHRDDKLVARQLLRRGH